MSYWLDWWLLLGFGIVISGVSKKLAQWFKLSEYTCQWLKRFFYVFVLVVFYILSVALLCGFTMGDYNFRNPGEVIGPEWLAKINDKFFGIIRWFYAPYYQNHPFATSTEFMFSSGQEWLRQAANIQFDDLQGLTAHPGFLFVGVGLFMTYPILLYWGIELGDLLWGSKPGKPGMFRLGWGIIMIAALILVPILMAFSLQNTILPIWAWIIILEVAIFAIFYGDFVLVQRKKG